MKRHHKIRSVMYALSVIGIVSLFTLASSGIVSAVGNNITTNNGSSGNDSGDGQSTSGSDSSQSQQGKLGEAQLKACEKHQAAINTVMARIANRSSKRLQLFDQITERIKSYYTEKNLSTDGYDNLIAAVTKARTAAQVAVQAEHSLSSQFRCDGDNPKGAITQFKSQQATELSTLKDYRTSISDLAASIKASVADTDGEQ